MEESLSRALVRKFAAKFNRRYDADIRLLAGRSAAGSIIRRDTGHGEVDEEHLGPVRAARYMRKFYPWYLERLGVRGPAAAAFQRTETLDEARRLLTALAEPLPAAA